MLKFYSRHRESLFVGLLGFAIFGLLNMLMLQMNYDIWTSIHYGAYTAYHRGWELSGFDNTTYIAVAEWRPLYVMMRHPLIMYYIWPMYQLADFLRDELHINCTIFVVAGCWTVISTVAWMVLYRIMRKIIGLPCKVSLLLCLFYFSFSHVMLATFAPDHMILSMTLFLIMLYITAKAAKRGKQVSTWKSLVLAFVSTGIATTNFAKIWLIDVCSMKTFRWKKLILHGMLYFLPLAAVGGLYWYETETLIAEDGAFAEKKDKEFAEKYPGYVARITAKKEKIKANNEAKQLSQNKLFQWTDVTVPIVPSIVENFFGEGLQLHDEYTLKDSHIEGHRPDIVPYSHWYNYLAEALIVLLFVMGAWFGRKERLMWMALSVFFFDCLLHLGLRFALNDVYIMTAHWAFVIPIAVGYLYLHFNNRPVIRGSVLCLVGLLTLWLWYHNLSLTYDFILNVN